MANELLLTNVVTQLSSDSIKENKYPQLLNKDLSIANFGMFAELFYGVQNSQHRKQNQATLIQLMPPLEIAEFDTYAASSYGQIRTGLESLRCIFQSLRLRYLCTGGFVV
jgi:predicted nucleic acid-binding protein